MTDNLAKHLLNDSEVLFQIRDLRTLANLQESMVRECLKPADLEVPFFGKVFEILEYLNLRPFFINLISVLPTF